MKRKVHDYLAFTLVELVIAIIISAIIFLGVLNFVGDTLYALSTSNKSSQLIISIDDVIEKIGELNGIYEEKSLLIDSSGGEGTDILLLTDSGSTGGVILALVNPKTSKVFTGVTEYNLYNKKNIGYRMLSSDDLTAIMTDSSTVYSLLFQRDKIYSDIHARDFQMTLYNSGTIVDMYIPLLLSYEAEKFGLEWVEIGSEDIYNINLNF